MHDVAIQTLPVRFAIDRAGLVGADGPTHAGAFDVAYLGCLPGFVVMAAADEAELVHMVATAAAIDDRPSAFRYPRGEGLGVPMPEEGMPLEIGKGRIVREGTKVALLSFGARLGECLKAADELAALGLSTTVADARFAKPLDTDLVLRLAREHEVLITIEEGAIGGFGALCAAGAGRARRARPRPEGAHDGAARRLHRSGFAGGDVCQGRPRRQRHRRQSVRGARQGRGGGDREARVSERLLIARIGHRADGIADTPQGPVFVPFTLPGETALAEPFPGQPERRKLAGLDNPSPERTTPICPYFGVCGGCATQHWALPPYLHWKRAVVVETLRQAGIEAPVDETIDAHGEGRRRVVFHARRGEIGYMAAQTHDLVAIDVCPILAPAMKGAIPAAQAIAKLFANGKPLDIQVTATASGLDVDVRGSGPSQQKRARRAGAHRRRTSPGTADAARRDGGAECRAGAADRARRRDVAAGGVFAGDRGRRRHAGAAGRSNMPARQKTSPIFFPASAHSHYSSPSAARVTAYDSDAPALAALAQAMKNATGLKPVTTQTRDLFRQPVVRSEMKPFDALVFDPPRQGAEAQVREIAESSVPKVIAVSCNPATFARDARILIDGGYKLKRVTPVDQFRYSAHIELVARFTR